MNPTQGDTASGLSTGREEVRWLDLDRVFDRGFQEAMTRWRNRVSRAHTRCGPQPGAISDPLFEFGGHLMTPRHRQQPSLLPHLGIARIRTCVAVPPGLILSRTGSICWSQRQFSKETVRRWFDEPLDQLLTRSTSDQAIDLDEPCVLLARPGDHIYGHWLADILPRVWLAEGYRRGRFRYVIREGSPRFVYDLLALLGVESDRVIRWDTTNQRVTFQSAYVPTNVRFDQYFHPIIGMFGDQVRSQHADGEAPGTGDEKLYVSRTQWAGEQGKVFRRLENQARVETIASRRGYRVVAPETLSIPEQVRCFARASVVIGEDGSGLHNTLFARANTVVGILRSQFNGSLIQGSLCAGCRQRLGYLIGTAIDKPPIARNANYRVDEDEFSRMLDRVDALTERSELAR